jgi:hypothetical protein
MIAQAMISTLYTKKVFGGEGEFNIKLGTDHLTSRGGAMVFF